jgi:NADH:ubiquinone oxidoreductase subunit E
MTKKRGRSPAKTKKRDKLLVRMEEEQRKSGYLSPGVMVDLGQAMGLSVSDVYGVTTFYSFLSTQPMGKHVIRICKSLPCHVNDGEMIMESIAKEIGIGPGETTPDGRFSFELTNCIGACDQAPAMLIDDDVHGNLTPAKITEILKAYT